MNDEISDRLSDLKIEEFIWIIYIAIIFLSFYSNSLERKYFIYKDEKAKEQYRNIMILIFSVLIVVYFYFLHDSYKDLKKLEHCSKEKTEKVVLSFIASLLITISGVIFLYLAYKDENLDVELAFT